MVSRRTFILGGVGTVALAAGGSFAGVEEGVLPGRYRLARLTGQCGVDASPPKSDAVVTSGTFASSKRKRTVGWSVATPPGESPSRVALVLHGKGETHRAAFDDLKMQDFLAAAVKNGTPPFALASVDAGSDTYYHPRADGDDPLGMLTEEFLPLLGHKGFAVDRIGVLGWSMGGYGALLLARQSHRGTLGTRVAVAAAASPALFSSYGSSAPGAFDSASDFATYGTLAAQPDVGSTPLFVACGADDAFCEETKKYRDHVDATPAGGISKGCHDAGFWRSQAGAQLAFVGAHLTAT